MKKLILIALLVWSGLANAAAPVASCSASRTSGVAPLAVFFDATATTDADTTRPFHDLQYTWYFGDDAAGLWTNGANTSASRNYDIGPVASHVFETAGTFTVRGHVTDGTTTSRCADITITVTDEDAYYTTTNTTCVSSNTTPTAGAGGCPTGAAVAQQSDFYAALTSYAGTGKRVLFKKGDSFTVATGYIASAAGPAMVGAYGTGASPAVAMSVINQYASIIKINNSDWRIVDLAFDGTGTTDQMAINTSSTPSQVTVLRVTVTKLNSAVNLNSADQLTVVDSNFSQGGSGTGSNYGVWCGTCTNVALLGNSMYLNTNNSHNIRLQAVTKFVVSHSTQTGSNLIEPITIRGNTQYGMLSGDKFVDNNVTIKPQNSTSDEYQRDIIFDRNWFVAGSYTSQALSIEGSSVTVRNNLFDLSASLAYTGIQITYNSSVGAPQIDLVNFYNNTFYNSAANNGNLSPFKAILYFGGMDANCRSDVQNNLAYSPNTINTAPVLIYVRAGDCVVTGAAGTLGNSSDAQILSTSPAFAGTTNPVDFRTTNTATYPASGGESIFPSSRYDFFGCTDKTGVYRSGAFVPAASARCYGGK